MTNKELEVMASLIIRLAKHNDLEGIVEAMNLVLDKSKSGGDEIKKGC